MTDDPTTNDSGLVPNERIECRRATPQERQALQTLEFDGTAIAITVNGTTQILPGKWIIRRSSEGEGGTATTLVTTYIEITGVFDDSPAVLSEMQRMLRDNGIDGNLESIIDI